MELKQESVWLWVIEYVIRKEQVNVTEVINENLLFLAHTLLAESIKTFFQKYVSLQVVFEVV